MTRLFIAAFGVILLSLAAVTDATTVQYRYDELDRLYRAEYDDGSIVEYTYDNVGNRIAMNMNRMAVNLTADPPSPQPAGGSVTLTAAATGGSGSYEYQYLANVDGGPFSPAQHYSTNPVFNWTNTGAPGHTYVFRVNARNVGSSSEAEATTTLTYVVQ